MKRTVLFKPLRVFCAASLFLVLLTGCGGGGGGASAAASVSSPGFATPSSVSVVTPTDN